jgi:hypothetical protein
MNFIYLTRNLKVFDYFPDFERFVEFANRQPDPPACIRFHYLLATSREGAEVKGMKHFAVRMEQKYRDVLMTEHAPPLEKGMPPLRRIVLTDLELLFEMLFDMMYAGLFKSPQLKLFSVGIFMTVDTGLKWSTLYKRMSEAHQAYLESHPGLAPVLPREPWRNSRKVVRR